MDSRIRVGQPLRRQVASPNSGGIRVSFVLIGIAAMVLLLAMRAYETVLQENLTDQEYKLERKHLNRDFTNSETDGRSYVQHRPGIAENELIGLDLDMLKARAAQLEAVEAERDWLRNRLGVLEKEHKSPREERNTMRTQDLTQASAREAEVEALRLERDVLRAKLSRVLIGGNHNGTAPASPPHLSAFEVDQLPQERNQLRAEVAKLVRQKVGEKKKDDSVKKEGRWRDDPCKSELKLPTEKELEDKIVGIVLFPSVVSASLLLCCVGFCCIVGFEVTKWNEMVFSSFYCKLSFLAFCIIPHSSHPPHPPASMCDVSGLFQGKGRALWRLFHSTMLGRLAVKPTEADHKLAVIVPYRDRLKHAERLVGVLHEKLKRQNLNFQIFFLEQKDGLAFNRGLLLNAAVLLLEGTEYDYFCFHDVDTIPAMRAVSYGYPKGNNPVHLTPLGLHPTVQYDDFFGGNTIFTREQFDAVNGYGVNFWGWGKEDDNMRLRLMRTSMWPPEIPVYKKSKPIGYYFVHLRHEKASEVRIEADGSLIREPVDWPYKGKRIANMEPEVYKDYGLTGKNTTKFSLVSIESFLDVVKFVIDPFCDVNVTPWCKMQSG